MTKREQLLDRVCINTDAIVVRALDGDNAQAEAYRAAFAQIANKADWKAPVHALIPSRLAGLYVEAVRFMTATDPRLQLTAIHGSDGHLLLRLISEGYQAGPAGDH